MAEIEYLEPGPDTLFIQIVIALLYILAIASFLFFWWLGHTVVVFVDATGQLAGNNPTALLDLRLAGALIGLPPGILSAVVLCAMAQGLGLFIRIERNTRRSTELLYHLLTEGRAGPPR